MTKSAVADVPPPFVMTFAMVKNAFDNKPDTITRSLVEVLREAGPRIEMTRAAFAQQDEDKRKQLKNGRAVIMAGFDAEQAPRVKGGWRTERHVTSVGGASFDLDYGTPTLALILERMKGLEVIVHESASSTPEKPRFRVFAPYPSPVPVERHRGAWQALADVLDPAREWLDRTLGKDSGRLSYCPPHFTDYAPEIVTQEGERFNPEGVELAPAKSGRETPLEAFKPRVDLVRELLAIRDGESYHEALLRITASFAGQGIPAEAIYAFCESWMHMHRPAEESPEMGRWAREIKDLERTVRTAVEKFAPETSPPPGFREIDDETPEPVNIFAEIAAPPFPTLILPDVMQRHAHECAASSGFDVGAYGFNHLIEMSNIIDHRARFKVSPTWGVPSFQWAAAIDPSGGGKSPVIRAVAACTGPVYDDYSERSRVAYERWQQEVAGTPKGKPKPPEPPWRSRLVTDITVEALAAISEVTQEGVNMRLDEIAEWVGRMDSYHGGGQDRSVYIAAYDGGSRTIDRKTGRKHYALPNWSLGLLGGIQPEKLAELYRMGPTGASSDGLFQRFVMYRFEQAGKLDLSAPFDPALLREAQELYRKLDARTGPTMPFDYVPASEEVRSEIEDYVNTMREIKEVTPPGRWREHLGKFPGFMLRFAFALQVARDVVAGEPAQRVMPGYSNVQHAGVTLEAVQDARKLMGVLYRHSEAFYRVVDSSRAGVIELARAVAEAILSKGWEEFKWGDLTRDATHWQGSQLVVQQDALGYLIEMDWIRDITEPEARKRGRPSMGQFWVNPRVQQMFAGEAARVRLARHRRFEAIQRM